MDNIKLILREILKNNTDITISVEEIDANANLDEYGINSISFIKFIVAIENKFEIEFDDEKLDFKKLSTIKSLVDYITEKMQTEK